MRGAARVRVLESLGGDRNPRRRGGRASRVAAAAARVHRADTRRDGSCSASSLSIVARPGRRLPRRPRRRRAALRPGRARAGCSRSSRRRSSAASSATSPCATRPSSPAAAALFVGASLGVLAALVAVGVAFAEATTPAPESAFARRRPAGARCRPAGQRPGAGGVPAVPGDPRLTAAGAGRPRRRRRRRRWSSRVALAASDQAASPAQAERKASEYLAVPLGGPATVRVHGEPFLTQAMRGRYGDVEVTGAGLRFGDDRGRRPATPGCATSTCRCAPCSAAGCPSCRASASPATS